MTGAGAFMAMLDTSVANLALLPLQENFRTSLGDVQWVVTGYLIALAVSMPMTGWLCRQFGHGRVWQMSMTGFVAASALCALSETSLMLSLARGLQGLAAGIMVPSGQAVLASVSERRQLGRLMGTVGFAVALGPALGPGVGGVLIETVSWRGLFWMNVPIGAVAIVAGRYLVPAGDGKPSSRLDAKGLLLCAVGFPLVLFGLAEISTANINWQALVSVFLGGAFLNWALQHFRHVDAPLINLALFSRPGFAGAAATAGLTGAAMYSGLLLFPIYLQVELNFGDIKTGGMLLVMGLGAAIALPFAGYLTDRYGPAAVSGSGAVLLLLGTLPFGVWPIWAATPIAALLCLRGIGLALAQMPAMTAAFTVVQETETGDAATLVNVVQRVGGALGATAMVLVIELGGTTQNGALAFPLLTLLAAGPVLTSFWLRPAGRM
ncbi:DHA2 family efflux MFS transporter permease subunit [Roseibium aggregatum]|uniref:DHA2 family efflux MFS transporter permease subunit n=1 Tax=Roseibium aggregatum TaxID=187304 RepID=UPI00227D90A4|nr:DHA2 family efflux MFS transporter permease subunit [Roseibium aggregatum]